MNPLELITSGCVQVQDLEDKVDELLDDGNDEDATRLLDFLAEVSGCDEVIIDSYVDEYFEDLVKEFIPSDFPSWIRIDYDETYRNMLMDYIEVEFEGETFYAR